jgi:hypothetical protein
MIGGIPDARGTSLRNGRPLLRTRDRRAAARRARTA